MGKKRKELRPMASPNQLAEKKSTNLSLNANELKPSDVLSEEEERAFWSKNADRFTKKEFEEFPPLVRAVYLGCEKAVEDLLKAGEDLHVQIPKDGSNLVMIAIIMHHNTILKKLIEAGVDWRDNKLVDGTTSIMASVSHFNYPAFHMLREITEDDKALLDTKFMQGQTLLHLAVKGCGDTTEQYKIIRTLLKLHHHLLLVEDDFCCTALCLSFLRHQTDVSKIFLEEMNPKELDAYVKRRMDLLQNPELEPPFLEQTLLPLLSCMIRDLQADQVLRNHLLPILVQNAEELAKHDPALINSALQPREEDDALVKAACDAGLLPDHQDKRQEGDGPHRKKSPKKVKNITFTARFESKADDSKKVFVANLDPGLRSSQHTGYADALKKNLSSEAELIERQADLQIVAEKETSQQPSSSKEVIQKKTQDKNSSPISPNTPTKRSSIAEKILSLFTNLYPSVCNKLKKMSPSQSTNEIVQSPSDSSFSTAISNADSSSLLASNEESLESSASLFSPEKKDPPPKQPPKTRPIRTNRRSIVCKILQQGNNTETNNKADYKGAAPETSKRVRGRTYSDVARTNIDQRTSDESVSHESTNNDESSRQDDTLLKMESFPELPYRPTNSNEVAANLIQKSDNFPELPKKTTEPTTEKTTQPKGNNNKRSDFHQSEDSFLDDSKSSFSSIENQDEQAYEKISLEGSSGQFATPLFPAFETAHRQGTPARHHKSVKTQKYTKFYRRLTTRKLCHRKLFSTPKTHSSFKDAISPAVKSANRSSKRSKILKTINPNESNFNGLPEQLDSPVSPKIESSKKTTMSDRSWVFKRANSTQRRPSVREVVMQRKWHQTAPRVGGEQGSGAAQACGGDGLRSRWRELLRGLGHCMPLAQHQLEQHRVETSGARVRAVRCSLAGKVLFGPRLGIAKEGGSFVGLLERGMSPVVVREAEALDFPFEDIPKWRSISHINLTKFIDYSIDGRRAFLVRELCEFSLPEFIKGERANSRSMPFVKRLLVQELVEGLRYLHERKVVHGFIKPNNVLVSIDYRLKLADFFLLGVVSPIWGIRVADPQAASSPTSNLSWRPSELIAAKSESDAIKSITAATDIQMAGMVLYYIWSSGHHPYGEGSDLECQRKVAEGSPSLGLHPSDVEARDLVSQALEFCPSERPTVQAMSRHPYFWDSEKRFQFLLLVGRKIEFFTSKPTKIADEFRESCIEARDWTFYIQPDLMRYVSSCTSKKYTNDLPDLLQFALILQENFDYMPSDLRSFVIEPSRYVLTTFPTLLMSIYHVIRKNNCLQKQMALQIFF